MATRIDLLREFLNEDPDDPFNLYALALEYQKDHPAKAADLYNRLLEVHPEYVPTYYHLAKLYRQQGDEEKALQVLNQGIKTAAAAKDLKALGELQAARMEIITDE